MTIDPANGPILRQHARRMRELAAELKSLDWKADSDRDRRLTQEFVDLASSVEALAPEDPDLAELRSARQFCQDYLDSRDALIPLSLRFEAVAASARALPRDSDHEAQALDAILELLGLLVEMQKVAKGSVKDRVDEALDEAGRRLAELARTLPADGDGVAECDQLTVGPLPPEQPGGEGGAPHPSADESVR